MTFSRIVSDWREFETFLASIYRDMSDVEVQHDVTIADKEGIERQIDVLVRFRRGAHQFMVIIEAKYWRTPIERAQVDELILTVQKFNASKGVFFTTVGYQEGARRVAEANGIDIFCVKDPTKDNWWPWENHESQVQVCSFAASNKLRVDPVKGVEIGTAVGVEWPRGIQTTPPVSFRPTRSVTPVLNRAGGRTLEDEIEGGIVSNLQKVVGSLGPIGGGKDCIGHITVNFDLTFKDPIVVKERDEPLVILRISDITVPVLIRIEQRVLRWQPPTDLEFAASVENVVTGEKFQVGRARGEPFPTWMPASKRPFGTQIPHDHRVVIVAQESFRPEMFTDPWDSYGKVAISSIDEVPPSKALERILALFKGPIRPDTIRPDTIRPGNPVVPAADPATQLKVGKAKATSSKHNKARSQARQGTARAKTDTQLDTAVMGALNNGPAASSTIQREVGASRNQIRSALRRLMDAGQVTRAGERNLTRYALK